VHAAGIACVSAELLFPKPGWQEAALLGNDVIHRVLLLLSFSLLGVELGWGDAASWVCLL